MLARYERLSDAAQTLLRLLSIGGMQMSHPLLEAVFLGESHELEQAAREAVSAGVLVVDGDDYVFRHALVREAILGDLLLGERARYHACFAEAISAQAGQRRLAAELSFHWLGARDYVRAFPATLSAMREARAAYAYGTAADLGERAIELWEQVPGPEAKAGMSRMELIGRTASYLRTAGDDEHSAAIIALGPAECPPDDPNYAKLLPEGDVPRRGRPTGLGRPSRRGAPARAGRRRGTAGGHPHPVGGAPDDRRPVA